MRENRIPTTNHKPQNEPDSTSVDSVLRPQVFRHVILLAKTDLRRWWCQRKLDCGWQGVTLSEGIRLRRMRKFRSVCHDETRPIQVLP